MKAVIQRVVSGSVSVDRAGVSSIGRGIVALVGIHRDDTKADLDYIVRKLVSLRLWEDEGGRRWAKSANDLDLEILCVSQFTLYHIMKVNKIDRKNLVKPINCREISLTFTLPCLGTYQSCFMRIS